MLRRRRTRTNDHAVPRRWLTAAALLAVSVAGAALPGAFPAATSAAAAAMHAVVPQALPQAVPTAGGLKVFVGYAEDKEINTPDPAAFPVPWAGSANTTFLGGTVPGQTACGSLTVCYDGGAIRLDNPGSAPVTVSSVSVDVHSSVTGGKVFSNLWGSFTVDPGKSVILTANPPANNPGYDNFDTSSYPANNCIPITVAPTVTITIGGVATTLADSTHVLDTGGIDAGFCPPKHNESIQWRAIGAPGSTDATLTLPPVVVGAGGAAGTDTATLLDGSGDGLPNVVVKFAVIAGPDTGAAASVITDASGVATFTLPGSGQGDDVTASVTTVGVITADSAAEPCPAPWTCADIGSPAPPGSQWVDPITSTWTISAGGADITGTSDQFRFVSQPMTGNGSVVAYVASQSATSVAAKAGLMFRTSMDPAAPNFAVVVSPGQGIKVQVRKTQGGSTGKLANPAGTTPAWLKITRSGNTFTAYTSADGVTWTLIPGSAINLSMPAGLLAGLAVTSHNNGTLGTVVMNAVAVG
jgi:hypothetical protein